MWLQRTRSGGSPLAGDAFISASASTAKASPASRLPQTIVLLALLLASLLGAGVVQAQAIEPLPFKDQAQEVRFQDLTRQLRCLVCQNENLADSNAELARDLRLVVFKLMQEGKTDDQIKDYLVARYSSFVLYDPPLQPGTWLLWFGPPALLLAGAGVVLVAIRRRRHDTAIPPPPLDNGEDW